MQLHVAITLAVRRCEKIGSGQNMSHNIFTILRKTGVGFKAFFVSWHCFTPSEWRRAAGVENANRARHRRPLHCAGSATSSSYPLLRWLPILENQAAVMV